MPQIFEGVRSKIIRIYDTGNRIYSSAVLLHR